MRVIVNEVNVREEQAKEVKRLAHKIAGLVCEARVLSEELENLSREDGVEDDHLEAECYDWAAGLSDVETRVDELIAEYYSEAEQ